MTDTSALQVDGPAVTNGPNTEIARSRTPASASSFRSQCRWSPTTPSTSPAVTASGYDGCTHRSANREFIGGPRRPDLPEL